MTLRMACALGLTAMCGGIVVGCHSTVSRPSAIAHPPSPTDARPRPYPVFETSQFARAVERGTRTRDGRPGPRYWQQRTRYQIDATLDPLTSRISGRETVWYVNRSPDSLPTLVFYLNQNLFAPDAIRNVVVPITGGTVVTHVDVAGLAMTAGPSANQYEIDGTWMAIHLTHALAAGDSTTVSFEWSFILPPDGAPREGVVGDSASGRAYMVAYWYPQAAVYDDVVGWEQDPYVGLAEFYMGYADYDVSVTVPTGWLVGATGELTNPSEVLAPATRERLAAVRRTGTVIHVADDTVRGGAAATTVGVNGRLTWRFKAHDVRDFAFGTSVRYLWDATIAVVAGGRGAKTDTVVVNSFYRPIVRRWDWAHAARDGRFSIEYLSSYLWPYPYPQVTLLDGPQSCAGMEYPMATCIGGARDTLGLFSVVAHELGHMWFPMQVGSDERRSGWMDEGVTRFNQIQQLQRYYPGDNREATTRNRYLEYARSGEEVPLMRPGDQYPYADFSDAYSRATYEKMAINMLALRALLGDSLFMRAYREYGRRWINKHPTPYDFFNTFDNVSGRDLSWFWRTWWFETWTLDQAIGEVTARGDSLLVTVEDRGLAPMPVRLVITRRNGQRERREIPVDIWLSGARRTTIAIDHGPDVVRVDIDPEGVFPDIDPSNNTWTRPH